MQIVFEAVKNKHKPLIEKYLKKGFSVWVIEPFTAYHYKEIKFFPPLLPSFAKKIIERGKITLIKADEINAREIYPYAADKAVGVLEQVYAEYYKCNQKLISFVVDTLKSPIAENIFYKILCEKLAEFYSENFIINKINAYFNEQEILFYPNYNSYNYRLIKELLLKCEQNIFLHPNIKFPIRQSCKDLIVNCNKSIQSLTKLAAQVIISLFTNTNLNHLYNRKKKYKYGMTIISPRQLRDINNGLLFLVDNKKIKLDEIAFFQLYDLSHEDRKKIIGIEDQIYLPPKAGYFFSNFSEWKKLFFLAIRKKYILDCDEVEGASISLFNYFKWLKLMENINIRHFISCSDFTLTHIGRNIALNKMGIQTWYYTDSINSSVNFSGSLNNCKMRHPFWSHLYYDHLVTWAEYLVDYYKIHHSSIKKDHIVGCIWSKKPKSIHNRKKELERFGLNNTEGNFIIAAFDSSYSYNSITSYKEGVAFAEHLIKLADEIPDIKICLKEKKDRNFFKHRDPINGPKLVDAYQRISAHKKMCAESSQVDLMDDSNKNILLGSKIVNASELISAADMVISFPFTSTTFEALSINKPAIWHDPMGLYKNTPFSKLNGIMTHSYEELKDRILEIKSKNHKNTIVIDPRLMDPYRDGEALNRFRELLLTN